MRDPSREVLQSPAFPRAVLGSPFVLQGDRSQRPAGHPAPTSRHHRNPMSGPVESAAQPEAAVQSQSRILTRFLNHGAAGASPHTPGAVLDHTNPSLSLTGQRCHCPQAASSTSGSPGHQGGLSRGSCTTREVVHQNRCKMGLM